LDNALHYTPAGATVTLRLEAQESCARLIVADTGQGIAAEHLPHVFERFYRADKARARPGGGSGLGLAIVKHLAEAHGGWGTGAGGASGGAGHGGGAGATGGPAVAWRAARCCARACARSARCCCSICAHAAAQRSLQTAARMATSGLTLARAQCMPLPLSRASTTSLLALSTMPL